MLPTLLLVALLDARDVRNPDWGEDPHAPRGYQFFGDGLADVGDLDGDGLDEFTVADSWGSEPGTVWILSGADAHEVARLTAPERGRYFGSQVVRVPDVDGDGLDEIAVGAAPAWRRPVPDVVYLYSGRTRALLRTIVPRFGAEPFALEDLALVDVASGGLGDLAPRSTHSSSNRVGDIDLDGVTDYLVVNPEAGFCFGTVSCRSGRSGKILWEEPPWPSWRNVELSWMGSHLAVIVDFDRDGVRDFIWGPDNAGNGSPGLVFISSGKTGRALDVLARGPNLSVLRLGPKG
jgi:hypothetical protein